MAWTSARRSWVIFIEQNFGSLMEQKCATLWASLGTVSPAKEARSGDPLGPCAPASFDRVACGVLGTLAAVPPRSLRDSALLSKEGGRQDHAPPPSTRGGERVRATPFPKRRLRPRGGATPQVPSRRT